MAGHSVLKPHGYATWTLLDGSKAEADFLRCCHCGGQFQVAPGSGKQRGWCGRCGAVTCGGHACMDCLPVERRLDLKEKGVRPDAAPVTISTGGVLLGKG